MPGVRLTTFAGMMPIIGARLLDQQFSVEAMNTLLINGWLRPMPKPKAQRDYGGDIKSVLGTKDQDNITVFHPAGLNFANSFNEVRSMLHRNGPDYLFARGNGSVAAAYSLSGHDPFYAAEDFGFRDVLPAPELSVAFYGSGDAEAHFCNVSYCYTITDQYGHESPPSLAAVYQESIPVDSQMTVDVPALANPIKMGVKFINFYRMVTPFLTGDAPDNPIDAAFLCTRPDWFWDGTGPTGYTDVLLVEERDWRTLVNRNAAQFPKAERIAVSPDGYLAVQSGEYIYISKRHQYHIMPLEHVVAVPGVFRAMGWKDSTLYVATNGRPARITVEGVSDLARITVDLYHEGLPCLRPDSFTVTSFGAMYASTDGMVSLMPSGAFVSTHDLIPPSTWRKNFQPVLGVWYHGRYIGYDNALGYGFIFDFADTANGKHALSEIVKFSFEFDVDFMGVSDDFSSLFIASGSQLYTWDITEFLEDAVDLLTYRWVSKTFVLPGSTQMAAVKIVMAVDGSAEFILYANERKVYERSVFGNTTFRLPSSYSKATDFVIELQGTAIIQEVHVATSMQDLVE